MIIKKIFSNFQLLIGEKSTDLFDYLHATGCNFAISEFDNEFILKEVRNRNLYINKIGERRNLGNIRTEILITNYRKQQLTLF